MVGSNPILSKKYLFFIFQELFISSYSACKERDAVMRSCEKCEGTMILDREVDMEAGMALMVFVCINCGRRKQAEQRPNPLVRT